MKRLAALSLILCFGLFGATVACALMENDPVLLIFAAIHLVCGVSVFTDYTRMLSE